MGVCPPVDIHPLSQLPATIPLHLAHSECMWAPTHVPTSESYLDISTKRRDEGRGVTLTLTLQIQCNVKRPTTAMLLSLHTDITGRGIRQSLDLHTHQPPSPLLVVASLISASVPGYLPVTLIPHHLHTIKREAERAEERGAV